MYVWWKEKKTVFLYKEKKKDFSLRINVQKDWLSDHTSIIGKSGFVSHTKHTTEATITDLLQSWEITCNLELKNKE